ncbi:hypothetical protein K0T92_03920 [Paenibacillus oenotherae]|uniref:Lipoprotein n=1 Tax=Paenibacillus oenotherae TaxID=1435645 RepID=A0ABS7D1Y8_9BACL|nr:hypothetical protein [Paenibacillus oenotherae]MBW7473881.1 hypothetical protein [Paenibacillus oenotherae]
MYRQALFTLIALILAIGLISGCSSNSNTDKKVIEDLQNQLSDRDSEIESLNAKISGLQSEMTAMTNELDEVKNGPQNDLIAIRNSYEKKQYLEVIAKAKKIHEKYNGTPEDKEAQKLAASSTQILSKLDAERKAEADRKKAEAAKSAREKARGILRVSKVYPGEPNSADGVNLYVHWTNKSDKTIKYIYFEVVPYNAVGDIVSSDIGGGSTFRGMHTGPTKPGVSFGSQYYWENAWYNNTITQVQLRKVDITYMDESTITLSGDDITHIQY